MSNEKKKVVTNINNININTKFLNRTARYEIDKKGPAPTLKDKNNSMKLSYNLVPANKMPTLKMVMNQARKNRG